MNLDRVQLTARHAPIIAEPSFIDTVQSILNNDQDWPAKLVEVCEKAELKAPVVVAPEVYTMLLAAYLAQISLNNARFLWKRIPNDTKQSTPAIAALWNVGTCMWNRSHQQVHAALSSFPWDGPLLVMVTKIKVNYQQHVCNLLEHSFVTIKWDVAADHLGCTSKDGLVAVVGARGWDHCNDSFLAPNRQVASADLQSNQLEQLGRLTDLMVHLED